MRRRISLLLTGCLLIPLLLTPAFAAEFGRPAFRNLWARTDYPVQRGVAEHSWVWGPQPLSQELGEWYVDLEGNTWFRPVQYFDKGRMEITYPAGDPTELWYITGGLLARNIIDGQVQIGQGAFVPLPAPDTPVAGDPGTGFPTYADLRAIVRTGPHDQIGDHVAVRFTPDGFVPAPEYAASPATEVVTTINGSGVPRAFRDFLSQAGVAYIDGSFQQIGPLFDWHYIAGLPISRAFWTRVPVGGVERDIMVQVYERRILTYNPANPAAFQVEMGNVGQHYYQWRYIDPFAGGNQALITAPAPGVTVGSPLSVMGFENGTAFEAGILVRLRTAAGAVLAETGTSVHRPDIGIPGPFSTALTFEPPAAPTPGVVEVIVQSPRDGTLSVIASQPVTIGGQ